MLNFLALTPHPPIIIPEIGGDEASRTAKTAAAMKNLALTLRKADPDTIIVVSPHGLVYPDRINICGMERLTGSLAQFGYPNINFKFENDLELAAKLAETADENGIEALLYHNNNSYFEIDHGVTVPLYFLTKELDKKVKIIPIAYSFQDKGLLFAFGEIIQEIAAKNKKNIALIASGDLSHRLIQSAPAGYSESGKEFDKLIINHIKAKDIQAILEMDDDFIEEAGECGYRSILILAGALSKLKYRPEVLSYEGPFGVGYAVINFKII